MFAWLIRQRGLVAKGQVPAHADVEAAWKLFGSFSGMSADTGAALVVELAVDIGEPELVVEPAKFLTGLADRGQMFTTTMTLFIPRILGIAASASGDKTRAEMLLTDAVASASRLHAHAELARVPGRARIGARARRSGWCSRARRNRSSLGQGHGARAARAPVRGTCAPARRTDLGAFSSEPVGVAVDGALVATGVAVILFTDITDSVRLTEELGDWAFHDQRALLRALHSMIREFSGRPVEGITLGDGVLAEFVSAERRGGLRLGVQRLRKRRRAAAAHRRARGRRDPRRWRRVRRSREHRRRGSATRRRRAKCSFRRRSATFARTSSNATFTELGPHTLKGVAEPIPLFAVRDAH